MRLSEVREDLEGAQEDLAHSESQLEQAEQLVIYWKARMAEDQTAVRRHNQRLNDAEAYEDWAQGVNEAWDKDCQRCHYDG